MKAKKEWIEYRSLAAGKSTGLGFPGIKKANVHLKWLLRYSQLRLKEASGVNHREAMLSISAGSRLKYF